MDYGLTEEQEMLKTSAGDFLSKELSKKAIKELGETDLGYSPELWQKMSALGWTGLVFPEEYGGSGGSFLDLAVLFEAMGYNVFIGPFLSTVVLGGLTILSSGNETQKKEILPKVARGEMLLTMALTEQSASYKPSDITAKAVLLDDKYVLSGTKLFVPYAHVADYILWVARTEETANPEDGITIFLVNTNDPGVSRNALKTLARDKLCEITLDNVNVPKANVLGQLNQGWSIVKDTLQKAAIAQCAEMAGGAQGALDMAVNYAKEREQFDKPIGSFQAIQHYCADMLTDVEGIQAITHYAAWKVNEGLPATKEVSMAKAWTSEAYVRVTQMAQQIHGAIGYTWDHDVHLYFRRAKTGEIMFGDGKYHREIVAKELGL